MKTVIFCISTIISLACSAQTFFDRNGNPLLYYNIEKNVFFNFEGVPLYYLSTGNNSRDVNVYDFNGNHIAWHEMGRLINNNGDIFAFTKNSGVNAIYKIEPIKGIEKIIPIKSLEKIAPIKPVFSNKIIDVYIAGISNTTESVNPYNRQPNYESYETKGYQLPVNAILNGIQGLTEQYIAMAKKGYVMHNGYWITIKEKEQIEDTYKKERANESSVNDVKKFLDLFFYYSERDINKAIENIEKYIANSRRDCDIEFLYSDYLYRAGKYTESLNKAKAMENGACKNYPRLKVLYAYNYNRLGDMEKAKSNITSYLATANPNKIEPTDYLLSATILQKSPGSEEAAINCLKNALKQDTNRANRIKYMDTIALLNKKLGNLIDRFNWLQQSYNLKSAPSNLDIYNMSEAARNIGKFNISDSMARLYIQKYPEYEHGYMLLSSSARAQDSTTGASFFAVQQYIDFLARNSVKNASRIKYQYMYIASIAADKLKDYRTALNAVNKILDIDPSDSFATQAKPVLEKAIK